MTAALPSDSLSSPLRRAICSLVLTFAGLVAGLTFGVPAASAAPFACTTATVYVASGNPTQLYALIYGAGSTSFQPVGPVASRDYNAIGYNPVDNFIYGFGGGGGLLGMVRVHSDGSVEDLGMPTGIPAGSGFNTGAFDAAGNYYVTSSAGGNTTMYRVNVATETATPITLSQATLVSDFTYANGYLWGIRNFTGELVRVNPTTGQVDDFPQSALPGSYDYGTAWTYGNGNLGFMNVSGAARQVAISDPAGTPSLTFVSEASGPASGFGDGTSCLGLPTDLVVDKAGPSAAAGGSRVTWTIRVTNNGPGGSSGFTINDPIPAGVTDPQSTTPGCSISGGRLQCVLGVLAPGASTEINLSGNLPAVLPPECLTNTASVLANETDPNTANNTDSAEVCLADITIRKTSSDQKVRVGDPLTFTLTVRNNGPTVSKDTQVSDPVPSNLDATSVSSRKGSCSLSGNDVVCDLDSMAVGETAEVTVRTVARRPGGARNVAAVDDPACPTHPCNTTPPVIVKVVKPKLKITKQASKKRLTAGETVTYTIRTSNPSKVAVRRVRTCDRLPAGLVYVSSKPTAKLSRGQHCWTKKRLGAGKSVTYKVTVRALPGAGGRLVNTATATSPDARAGKKQRRVIVDPIIQPPPTPTG